jgi:uncharacterized protein YdeI (YjbR/CyaY-like superfamily)
MDKAQIPVKLFGSYADWAKWMAKNHDKSDSVWLKFAKKNSGEKSINYQEAVEVALCYGWIDSLVKGFDDKFYLQKFTPRRAKSIWSKINVEKAEKLIAENKMQPAGQIQVDLAKADGRWEAAYEGQRKMPMPEDFKKMLNENKKAKAFYDTLTSSNKYAILFRLHHYKKPETRASNIKKLIKMLEEGRKFHP